MVLVILILGFLLLRLPEGCAYERRKLITQRLKVLARSFFESGREVCWVWGLDGESE